MRTLRKHNDDGDSMAELIREASISYYFRNREEERREG